MGKLDDKVAIITGGVSGIGKASVRLFIEEGARVIFGDIQDERGKALSEELGPNAIYLHMNVRNESEKITAARYFKGGIYGAIGTIKDYSKDKVIKEIFKKHKLHGSELIIFGDGPVEILNAKQNNAIAVGVASDEINGQGWNETKIIRLTKAGCDILIPDFLEGSTLIDFLFGEK